MILVTGAAGFIGRHLCRALEGENFAPCDVRGGGFPLEHWLPDYADRITAVFHLGAISDTTCENGTALLETNVKLPLSLAEFCKDRAIPFIYASSASVYGNEGKPLNGYAQSKNIFDKLIEFNPPASHWYGLRFFNVYGPGEEHKGKQASLIHQILNGKRDLFALDTVRDFVHVDDVVSVMLWLWKNQPASGIYDVGTGKPHTIISMACMVSQVLGKPLDIDRVDMPSSLEGKYQFHTQADLTKLRAAGYTKPFLTLEEGIARCQKT